MQKLLVAVAAAAIGLATPALAASDCPNDGVVRFGVEPFDTAAKLVPIYDHIGKLLGDKLGCEVKMYVTTNYNAEIEAMRSGKLYPRPFLRVFRPGLHVGAFVPGVWVAQGRYRPGQGHQADLCR
jgi:ABC-type phosphate/phosphonate transport system substrate-binding protein